MRRLMQLAGKFLAMSIMQQTSYRKSFAFAVLTKLLRSVVLIVFFHVIFLHVPTIGSWRELDVLVLLAVYLSFEAIIIITWHRNLAFYFPDHLRKGTFDMFLVKPIPILRHTAFRILDVMDLISSLPIVLLWVYVMAKGYVILSPMNVILFLLACILAGVFAFSMSTIIAAVSFWSLTPTGVGRLFENSYRTGRYPIDSFGGARSFVLTYILPFAIVGTIPAAALRGVLHISTLLFTAIPIAVIAFMAKRLWTAGLKRYSSASS